jgi:hypothetical protein
LSRARRIVENAFGILSARWRIFQRTIEAKPDNADKIVLATVALHNYLTKTDGSASVAVANRYITPGFADYEDNNGIVHPG